MSRGALTIAGALTAAIVFGAGTIDPLQAIASIQEEDPIITVGDKIKPPVKTKHVSPVYPPEAREAGVQGIVVIEAVIDKEGKVAHAKVVRSIPELDQAALDAVLQWEFDSTYLNGKKVRVRMTVTINFTLE